MPDESLVQGLDQFLASEIGTVGSRLQANRDLPQSLAGVEEADSFWSSMSSAGWLTASREAFEPGGDLRPNELYPLMERFGYWLAPGPIELVAGYLIPLLVELIASDQATRSWLDAVCSADERPLVLPWGLSKPNNQAKTLADASGLPEIHGTFSHVPVIPSATHIYGIAATSSDDLILFRSTIDESAISIASSVDVSRALGSIHLSPDNSAVTHAFRFKVGDSTYLAIKRAEIYYSIYSDASAIGGARYVLERSVEYVNQRRQFGVPIGSFQSLKHILADVKADIELSDALALHTLEMMDGIDADGEVSAFAASSRLRAVDTFVTSCESAIQCHGAFGFTWESALHAYYRRAITDRALSNRNALWRDLAVDLLGLD